MTRWHAAAHIANQRAAPSRPCELFDGQRRCVTIDQTISRTLKIFLFDKLLSNLDTELHVLMRARIANSRRCMLPATQASNLPSTLILDIDRCIGSCSTLSARTDCAFCDHDGPQSYLGDGRSPAPIWRCARRNRAAVSKNALFRAYILLIPTCVDHDLRAHLRRPMVMMRHG